jgi:hypothetical protein
MSSWEIWKVTDFLESTKEPISYIIDGFVPEAAF